MNGAFRSFAVTASGAILSAIVLSSTANAGCGKVSLKHGSSWLARPGETSTLLDPVAFNDTPSIVGMWSIKFYHGADVVDFGYMVWHGDGTEFFNSGGRAPATQNYCLGVWKKTGWYTYRLAHYAISYDLSGKQNENDVIHESVTLDHDGNSFGGTYTIDAYDPTTGQHLGSQLVGTVAGARVTVD